MLEQQKLPLLVFTRQSCSVLHEQGGPEVGQTPAAANIIVLTSPLRTLNLANLV